MTCTPLGEAAIDRQISVDWHPLDFPTSGQAGIDALEVEFYVVCLRDRHSYKETRPGLVEGCEFVCPSIVPIISRHCND